MVLHKERPKYSHNDLEGSNTFEDYFLPL